MKTRKTLETNDISNPDYKGDQITCLKIVRIPMALGRSGQVISLIAIRIYCMAPFNPVKGGRGYTSMFYTYMHKCTSAYCTD